MSAEGSGNASSTTGNSSSTQDPGQTYAGGVPSNNGGVSTQSSSLYLFTFLATLLMLMLVSFAIVLRSFIMRRQYRRRLDDAIAHGYVFPPHSPLGSQRALGEKPKIWHRWISPSTEVYWQDIKPISASLLLNSAKTNEKHEPDTTPQSPPPTSPNFLSLFKPRRRRRSTGNPPSTSPAPHSSNTPSPASDLAEPVGVEISVLISMPFYHSQSSKGKGRETDSLEDEEMFPEVVLGIARVPYATEQPQ